MGNYILAKDEVTDYSGPAWVPFNLWQLREYPLGSTSTRKKRVAYCAEQLISGAGAKEIWDAIASKYDHANAHALELPLRCAEFLEQWEAIAKVTPGEHKKDREALKRMADQLATALDRYFMTIDPLAFDESEVDGVPNFTQLLSEHELLDMESRIDWHHYNVALLAWELTSTKSGIGFEKFKEAVGGIAQTEAFDLLIHDDRNVPGIVPALPSMVRRIGEFLAEDKDRPPLARPGSKNSDRNYFVRRLIEYFTKSSGSISPALIARITSLFFEQGITDNEVQQQRGRHSSGRDPKVKDPPP